MRKFLIRIKQEFHDRQARSISKAMDAVVSRHENIVDYWNWEADVFDRLRDNKVLAPVVTRLVRQEGIAAETVPNVFARIAARIGGELVTVGEIPSSAPRGRNKAAGTEMTPCRVEWFVDRLVAKKEFHLAEKVLSLARKTRLVPQNGKSH